MFFRRSFFWEMMIYKGLLRIVFAFPVSPRHGLHLIVRSLFIPVFSSPYSHQWRSSTFCIETHTQPTIPPVALTKG